LKVIRIFRVTLLLTLLAFFITACGQVNKGTSNTTISVSVYDRVVQSGVIKASYASYPPYCIKDANTGELSGIFVDILEEAAGRLDFKVEWVEEVGWGAIFEGLNSNRHDIFGAGIWKSANRGKVGDFSNPIFFNVIKAYGRADENRIQGLDDIDSNIRISTLDGAIEDVIAQSDFPNSERVSVSQLSPWSDVLLNIKSNKADVTFAEPAAVNLFLEKNPGTLAELLPDKVIRVFSNSFAFKLGEPAFKAMLNAALEEIQNDGTVDKIIAKYEKRPGEYLRLATPYTLQ
jgi:ABC-type amino acid transport substrate-binding protein